MHPMIQLVLALLLAFPLPAQTLWVTPSSGSNFQTISAALAAAKSGDVIAITKGVYRETLNLKGRNLSLLGVAASPGDVVITGLRAGDIPIRIQNHPAGRVSRIARLSIVNTGSAADGIRVAGGGGQVVCSELISQNRWSVRGFRGDFAMDRCQLDVQVAGTYQLLLEDVDHAQLSLCWLDASFPNNVWRGAGHPAFVTGYSGLVADRTQLEMVGCRVTGSDGGGIAFGLYSPGGTALWLKDSHCRISGRSTEIIQGGLGPKRGGYGGSGLITDGSRVEVFRAPIKAGLTRALSRQAPDVRSINSTVIRHADALAEVRAPAGFRASKVCSIELDGLPGSLSVTWIGIELRPFPSNWGRILLDIQGPVLTLPGTITASGSLAHSLDLRQLPLTFVGSQFILQSITLSPARQVGLSPPQVGVIAR